MSSRLQNVFPTFIYRGRLANATGFNRELTREIAALEEIDDHGVSWSRRHYPDGYSSYSSLCHLHRTSPNFAELEKRLRPHMRRFVKALKWDLMGRKPEMTTCWANSMNRGAHHTMHTHPMCVISGVYYVNAPAGSSPFKIEDPRMPFFMAAPPRRSDARPEEQHYMTIPPKAGEFVLFESWMRHEVPPHRGTRPRLSVSFNYEI